MTQLGDLPSSPPSYVVDSSGNFIVDAKGAFVTVNLPGVEIQLPTVLTRGPSGPYFSRKRFDEIWETIVAARSKADELKNQNDKRRLQKKIRAATEAIKADEQIKADRLERELSAAIGADRLKAKLAEEQALIDAANDDDEEAIALLLAA